MTVRNARILKVYSQQWDRKCQNALSYRGTYRGTGAYRRRRMQSQRTAGVGCLSPGRVSQLGVHRHA